VGLMLMLRIIQRETANANAQLLEAELSQSLEKTDLTSSSSEAMGATQEDASGESSATPTPSSAQAAGNSTGEKPTKHHFRRLIKFLHGHSVALRRILKAQNKSLAWMYAYTLVGESNLAVAPVHDKSWRRISRGYMSVLSTGGFMPTVAQLASRKGAHVSQTREPYTSKPCANCRHYNAKLGAKSVFRCDECKMVTLRDEGNATSNILALCLCLGAMSAAGLASLLWKREPHAGFEEIRASWMKPFLYSQEIKDLGWEGEGLGDKGGAQH